MEKIYWALIIVVIMLILAIGVILDLSRKKGIGETENGLPMSVVSIKQTDSFYNIQVEYPQFQKADAAFNQKISGLVTGEIDTFKKDAKDNYEARRATAPTSTPLPENPSVPFDFICTWVPTQLNDKYISFVLNIYYFSGGAHGLTEVDAFDYDLAKKKEIGIMDFLGSSQSALERLASVASQQVTAQLQGNNVQVDDNVKQMIEQGTQATPDNYKNFNFNPISLIIYFQQYQVAPGYVGPLAVTLYKDTMTQNLIPTDYLE